MARPREFDESVVLDRARNAFWANGISATSIAELSEATGLSVGSIYKAFNSKDGLCHRTLDDYLDAALVGLDEVLASGASALEGLEAWLSAGAERAASDAPTRGCYAVACATELAERDPAIRKRLVQHDRQMHDRLATSIRSAVTDGELDVDPDAGARLLATTMNGVQVEARKGISQTDARTTLALALHALRS